MKQDPGISWAYDGQARCWWCGQDPLYVTYHDAEWGVPVAEDAKLFEKICLEGFQAGLSWLTILRKRVAFRSAFANFDFDRVVEFGASDVDRLLLDAAIVRHRGKIESTIQNARRAIDLRSEFGSLSKYFWQFEPSRPKKLRRRSDSMAITKESQAMSKDLRRRGWSFVGPTTCYAFMQAMGLVNDHLVDCVHWQTVDELRNGFQRPGAGC